MQLKHQPFQLSSSQKGMHLPDGVSISYVQIVIPVFYRVDPSDARNQTGPFGISFSKLEERFKENPEKLRSWRNALKEAATLSGFHSLNMR